MKNRKWFIGVAALLAAGSLTFNLCAQTTNTNAPCVGTNCVGGTVPPVRTVLPEDTTTITVTNGVAATASPDMPAWLSSGWSTLSASGLLQATNYAIEPYLTYAANAPKGDRIGAGALLAYNFNNYVGAALGVDYLGQFSLVSANVTLKLPLHPFKNLELFGGRLKDITVIPFALAGVGKSFASGAEGAIAVTDAGGYVQFGHLWGGRFNVGACYGRWDNAGAWSGPRAHVFAGWSRGF